MRYLYIVLFGLAAISLKSQVVTSTVVSSAGGYASMGSLKWSYTLGESVVDFYPGGNQFSTGFQQSFESLFREVLLTLFLEGLYDGPGMHHACNAYGPEFTANVVDRISVSLHEQVPPFKPVITIQEVDLTMDGSASFQITKDYNADYYLAIHSRNHLETWTAAPVSFSGNTVLYNFTDAASKAYGNQLKDLGEGGVGLYAGDANHDGWINDTDIDMIAISATAFEVGYLIQDINGDGTIDALDLILVDNNAAQGISQSRP